MKALWFIIFSGCVVSSMVAEEVYCRYKLPTGISYGQIIDDTIHELDAAPWSGGKPTGNTVGRDMVQMLHPSVPTKIIGLGGSFREAWPDGKTPFSTVRWFLKPPTSAASPNQPVVIPAALDEILVETELAIVIGTRIKDGDEAGAEEAIFGYTVANDIIGSMSSFHRVNGEPLDQEEEILGVALKHGDGFAPFGPTIHRGYDWKNRMRTLRIDHANGEVSTYEHSTESLLYSPAKIVRDLSRVFVLEPGDIIMTGTTKALPARAGDRVVISVEGLGELENLIR